MKGKPCVRALLPAVLAVLVAPGSLSWGQADTPTEEEEATPRFGAGTEVVVLDVVVRDEQGRTVRDLRAHEIEVLEDGVR